MNAAFRALLEVAALAALAIWGRSLGYGLAGLVAPPAFAAVAWSVFTVPGDPSRGDGGRVAVPGWVRLLLEIAVFGLAVLALLDLGLPRPAAGLAAATALHYVLSRARVGWLLRGGTGAGGVDD